ncbi:hypothetical protein IEQ44_12035 [Nocardioides sp. Y6]|uniref:Uncharacterized protein n=1 Tax=Nocardioides malaquae TaxID=2773426 RepID=A0ABR9RUV5_9ACTN|nr:hypothetical protein [Nocardioides malaquae]MBE7325384.1 hypothetical protein [Nocardioides malaquae]
MGGEGAYGTHRFDQPLQTAGDRGPAQQHAHCEGPRDDPQHLAPRLVGQPADHVGSAASAHDGRCRPSTKKGRKPKTRLRSSHGRPHWPTTRLSATETGSHTQWARRASS